MARALEIGENRLWTEEELRELGERILGRIGERSWVHVVNGVQTSTEFARGDAHVERESGWVGYQIAVRGCTVWSNQWDDADIDTAIREVKDGAARAHAADHPALNLDEAQTFGPRPKTFFPSTEAAMTPEVRGEVFDQALNGTEAANLIGAGDLSLNIGSRVELNTEGYYHYVVRTYGDFSLTARTRDGKGSGWGWTGHEDWERVDADAVIHRAVDLAVRSANPVALEPGRYTVILEPTAVAPLLKYIDWAALLADRGATPFSNAPLGTNKIGLQMLDRRLGISTDPWDPDMPRDNALLLVKGKKSWIDKGVLQDLFYDEKYARSKNREPNDFPQDLRLFPEGPTQTLDEMISSTQRGVWVNRLSGVLKMNQKTDLRTGTTRDGTFLIENGKITKAIKNFRFNESLFFVLNKLEAVGEPVRAAKDIVAPRVKVRDFNFTSLSDAI